MWRRTSLSLGRSFGPLGPLSSNSQMDKVPIRKVAEEMGVNKDYALRLVKTRSEQLGLKPQFGKRNAVYLTRSDADRLIKDYEPRRTKPTTDGRPALRTEGFGFFYVIQLHPHDLPNRLKIGYTDSLEVRLSDHRTTAPTLKLVKSWPCKRTWEDAARASITRRECKHIGGEVYDGDVHLFVQHAEAFFAVMPQPLFSRNSSESDS